MFTCLLDYYRRSHHYHCIAGSPPNRILQRRLGRRLSVLDDDNHNTVALRSLLYSIHRALEVPQCQWSCALLLAIIAYCIRRQTAITCITTDVSTPSGILCHFLRQCRAGGSRILPWMASTKTVERIRCIRGRWWMPLRICECILGLDIQLDDPIDETGIPHFPYPRRFMELAKTGHNSSNCSLFWRGLGPWIGEEASVFVVGAVPWFRRALFSRSHDQDAQRLSRIYPTTTAQTTYYVCGLVPNWSPAGHNSRSSHSPCNVRCVSLSNSRSSSVLPTSVWNRDAR